MQGNRERGLLHMWSSLLRGAQVMISSTRRIISAASVAESNTACFTLNASEIPSSVISPTCTEPPVHDQLDFPQLLCVNKRTGAQLYDQDFWLLYNLFGEASDFTYFIFKFTTNFTKPSSGGYLLTVTDCETMHRSQHHIEKEYMKVCMST